MDLIVKIETNRTTDIFTISAQKRSDTVFLKFPERSVTENCTLPSNQRARNHEDTPPEAIFSLTATIANHSLFGFI